MTSDAANLTDEAVIILIVQDAKTDLFGILYDRYASKVYRKCMGLVKDEATAQDLLQDIFTKLFFQLSKFQGRSKFSTWLYSITYNHCMEFLRKNNRYQFVDIEGSPDIVEEVSEIELMAIQHDLLKKALDKLNLEDKMLLLMKYQDDMSIQDIMESLQVGESAIKMRLARARQRVKSLLEQNPAFN